MNKAIITQGGDGTAVPAGMVGEVKSSGSLRGFVNNGAPSTGWSLFSSLTGDKTLTPGVWRVDYSVYIDTTSGTSSGLRTAILTTDTTDGWGPSTNLSTYGLGNMNYSAGDSSQSSSAIVTVTSAGIVGGTGFDLYLKFFATSHSSFTGTYIGRIIASRIA